MLCSWSLVKLPGIFPTIFSCIFLSLTLVAVVSLTVEHIAFFRKNSVGFVFEVFLLIAVPLSFYFAPIHLQKQVYK